MARIIPAIRGKIGSNRYYSAKLSTQDLLATARVASERDNWADMSIDERIQREINLTRVRKEILPYLLDSEDRFFSSLVILLFTEPQFEEINQYTKQIPAGYAEAVKDIGFLVLNRGDAVILDGQHRFKAVEFAMAGKTDKGDVTGEFISDIVEDEFAVLFLTWDESDPEGSMQRVRRIFNKLNRYARKTGRADDIITSEDDGYAILTRRLMNTDEPFGVTLTIRKGAEVRRESIVNYKSNTIAKRSVHFTTISALHATVADICKFYGFDAFDEKSTGGIRPSDDDLDAAYEHVLNWWQSVIDNVPAISEAFDTPERISKLRQQPEGSESLLFKPAGQIVLFKGLELAAQNARDGRRTFDLDGTVKKLATIDWDVANPLWEGVLVAASGRIMARKENYAVTAELLHYLLNASQMSEKEEETLRLVVAKTRGKAVMDEATKELRDKDPANPFQLPAPLA